MKRTLAIVMSVIMMMAACTVFANAAPGAWGTSADDFQQVGDLEITWDPDVSKKIKLDGDMSDWADAGYTVYEISPRNLVSWVGAVDADWKMSCYFVADGTALYVGFYITDSSVAFASSADGYTSGDSFQIAFDWGRNIGDYLDAYPDDLSDNEAKDIFYSFGMVKDGDAIAPLKFMRQECGSTRTGLVYDGVEDPGENNEFTGMRGAANTTETGWCAEFSVDWARLSDDSKDKLYDLYAEKFYRDAKIGPAQELKIGCSLYCLNSSETGKMTWAAGTMKGTTGEDGAPQVTWTAKDDGVNLVLKYQEGMSFAENSGITILGVDETEGTRDLGTETESATEPATDAPTDVPTDTQTEPASSDVTTKATGSDSATTASGEKSGCSSVIGMGAVAVLMTAAAAAVALKKKN